MLPRPPVPDDAAAMRDALRTADAGADLVLTTAGISVGEEDHVRDALLALGGQLSVLKIAMKPGKPLGAGRIGGAAFIGLPLHLAYLLVPTALAATPVVLAYLLLLGAALARASGPLLWPRIAAYSLAGALFLGVYGPMLIMPRPDGKPG